MGSTTSVFFEASWHLGVHKRACYALRRYLLNSTLATVIRIPASKSGAVVDVILAALVGDVGHE